MDGRSLWRIVLGIVLVAALVGIGVCVYDAGMAQGVAQGAQVASPSPNQAVPGYPYGWYGHWHGPFGFGFGFLGLLFPIVFFFLIFGLVRALVWHPYRQWQGPYGGSGRDRLAELEELHRRFHESSADRPSGSSSGS